MIVTETRDRRLDVVVDAPASVSIYLEALVAAGRDRDPEAIRGAHRAAVDVAVTALRRHGLWSSPDGAPTLARTYEPLAARIEVVEHEAAGAPGLHSHVLVQTHPELGIIDGAAVKRALPYILGLYDRELTDLLRSRMRLPFRGDGERPELQAVPSELVSSWHPKPCRALVGAPQLR